MDPNDPKGSWTKPALLLPALPMIPVEDLLDRHEGTLRRLIDVLGCDEIEFSTALRETIRRFTAYVHLLPASESNHHAHEGGLLEHSLEVALWASQSARGRLGNLRQPGWERRRHESAMTLTAALAGLSHDLGKPASDLCIVSETGGHVWNPYRESLEAFGQRHGMSHYHIQWLYGRGERHRGFSMLMIRDIIHPNLLDRLRAIGPHLEASLLAPLYRESDESDPIAQCVLQADRDSAQRSLRDPRRPLLGRSCFGSDAFVLGAIRARIQSGEWALNVPGSPIWRIDDGLYLMWPSAAAGIHESLERDRIPGIPSDPDVMALFLRDRGVIEVGAEDAFQAMPYYKVQPEGIQVPLRAVRLRNPWLLLDDHAGSHSGVIYAADQGLLKEKIVDETVESSKPMDGTAFPEPTSTETGGDLLTLIPSISMEIAWQVRGGLLFLPHPETARLLSMDPLVLIDTLDRLGWLDSSVQKALRKIRVFDGNRGILLNPEISNALIPTMTLPKRPSTRKRHA